MQADTRLQTSGTISAQDQRDKALDQLLGFVREQIAGTTRGITLNIHRLPVEMFDEDGPFNSVVVRHNEGSTDRYLVGTKTFGGIGGSFEICGFSERIGGKA